MLRVNGAKDPDEFIRLKGADAFRNLLEGAENQVDYRLRAVTDKYDLSVDEQKVEFLKEASELVARLPGSVERQVYAMRVASMAGVNADVVAGETERRRKKLLRQSRREDAREQSRPERQSQPAEKAFRYENPASAVAEEGVIRLLYLEPELINAPLPPAEEFSSPVLAHIYTEICGMLRAGQKVSTTTLTALLSPEEISLVVNIIQKPELLANSRRSMSDYTERIKSESERRGAKPDFAAIARQKQNTAYDTDRKRKGYEG